MLRKIIGKTIAAGPEVLTVVFASAALLSQPAPAARSAPAGLEFPVTMRQKIAAGKTPVGTKVQAKLAVSTLVNGVVFPQDAILSGEVTESAAKSPTSPSRLAIRMDSARWTNGSAPIKVYLTAWYYPLATPMNQDLSSGLPDAANSPTRRTGAAFPGTRNPPSPFPGSEPDAGKDTEPRPASGISQHRVLMKNVEATRTSDGAVVLTSKHSTIKLDRQTTYVLAADGLASGPS
ncbi:MAG: hypothetical protein ACHP7J_05925 [Terriglobales bacterium]